jgi:hypothetical protein
MLPVTSKFLSAEEAREGFIAAKKWWEDEANLEKVRLLAHDVRRWLRVNKQRTDKKGDEKSEPWWEELPATENPERYDLRHSLLRQLVFGTGLRRLLNRMVNEQLLSDGAYNFIDEATNFAPMALHEELMAYRLSEKPGTTLTLEDVKDRFGLSEGTNSTKKRPFTLRMATFGLWTVIMDKENHYAISLGPVAEIFHREVFTPVRVEFEERIRGVK